MKTQMTFIALIGLMTISGNCWSSADQPYCGDELVTDGEQCDDGGWVDGDGCSSSCQFEFDVTQGSEAPADGRPPIGGYFTCLAPQQVDYYETCRLPERPALPTRPDRPTQPSQPNRPSRPIRPIPGQPPQPVESPTGGLVIGSLQLEGGAAVSSTSCDCPDPQPISVGEICSDKLYDLPCLHHQQAEELSERGISFDTVDLTNGRIGYQITTLIAERYGCTGEGQEIVSRTSLQGSEGVNEIACRFTLPECPCEAPKTPSEPQTPPEKEGPPAAIPPPASPPQVLDPKPSPTTEEADQVFLCRSGMSTAVGTRSGEEIPIASCPPLPAELAINRLHVELTRDFDRYLADRRSEDLEKLRPKAETILKGWGKRESEFQDYPVMAAQVPSDEGETPAVDGPPVEAVSIVPEDVEIVDSTEEGRGLFIHVNAPFPPESRELPPQAQGKGPQDDRQEAAMTVMASNNLDESPEEETDSAATRTVVIVPTEYLHAEGGGCSLVREGH